MYPAGLEILCKWIIKAWNERKSDLIQKSFNRCSVFNNIEEAEDECLFRDQSFRDSKEKTEYDYVSNDVIQEDIIDLFILHYNENTVCTRAQVKEFLTISGKQIRESTYT